ncbi:peptidase M3 [Sphingomonas oleivorans]|uniref:Peptidase M3 n=2 Tax=Sphingomonas oleivorans TaxID=1735121 RepID=A0A2T5FV55_9SPHN|nr:peptidase M3 [Sphingomonas oleivorans]
MSAAEAAPAAAPATANPLLAAWTGPYGGVPPWDRVKPELFPAALTAAIAERRAEIAAIAGSKQPASFANTVEALERAGQTLDRVNSLFDVMTSNMNSPAYQALDKEWAPKLSAANDEIILNSKLFARIEAVYNQRATLDPQQQRLVTRLYEQFVRSGAKLVPAQKAQLSAYNQQLAAAFSDFSSKLLADEDKAIFFTSEADLAGLPASGIAAAKAAAAERGQPGQWAIVNTRSAVDPFLTFATKRDLREKVWRAFVNRGDNGDANDTNATIAKIVKLRADRAKLLGFPSHAAWRMQDTMAKTPEAADALMMKVWPAAVARVKEEVADMQAIADKEGAKISIEPWDYRFYAEKVRKARYDLDQAEIKPYFELNNMIQAAFYSAGRLYGYQFREITGTVPVFEKNVRVWEVTKGGKYVGLFYGDYFARTGKRSGAWMTTYRGQQRFDGPRTTLASNNNNFAPAAPGEPVLISLDDAETLFHEFGHAIHYLSQDIYYPGLSGVPRDFVEFPSQVNEHWVLTRDVLDKFARHYQTKAPMPAALVDKIKQSEKFNQGFATVEYLASAIVDMDLHKRADGVVDVDSFERETLARIGMPKEMVMRHRLPQFGHLFSSDAYSAGYYSYLWSETMDADTWAAFEEAGNPWDEATAGRFLKTLLSTGNETDRAEAYRAFRGRDPDVKALLRQRGFPTE